jgi:putative transposase
MARPLRVLYPGAVYHVTARGNERRAIFEEDVDRHVFLEQLALAVERYGWVCHGYCLMGNHYHLLVETPRANLPTGMRHLNGCYAGSFNRRRGRAGHLLQGRYKAELVEKHEYLLALIRYLALNPLRTEPPLSAEPEEYSWSSYRYALGLAARPSWLTVDWVLTQFGRDYVHARARLRAFVDAGRSEEPPVPIGGIYLGSDDFVRTASSEMKAIPEIPREQWQPLRPKLEEIFAGVGAGTPDPVAIAYRTYGYTLREIAAHLGCHYATVSRRLRRSELRVSADA